MLEGSFTFAGVTFGEGSRLVVKDMSASMGDVRVEDAEDPYGDGDNAGRDRLGAGVWSWEIATDADDFEDEGINALDLWEELHAVWRVAVRDGRPGRLYPLVYTALGRTRRVYGRPRRVDIPTGNLLAMQGQAHGAVDFKLMDPYTYDEQARSVTIGRIAPASTDGVLLPATVPFVIGTAPGQSPGAIDVGGKAPTPFTATFKGPVTNPWLTGPGWGIYLEGKIDAGKQVVVDTREGTIDSGGTNVRPALRRGGSLKGRLRGNTTAQLTYGGTDATNTSSVTVTWRPAYYSI